MEVYLYFVHSWETIAFPFAGYTRRLQTQKLGQLDSFPQLLD
jgi:hypothetical protein